MSDSSFWWRAIEVLDPSRRHPVFHARTNSNSLRGHKTSPFTIFQEIANTTCIPCRVNAWWDPNAGIGESKRMEMTQYRGWVGCCYAHRPEMFCGLCLKDAVPRAGIAPIGEPLDRAGRWSGPGLVQNDDERTWQNCVTTCRSCRRDESQSRVERILGPAVYTRASYDLTCRIYWAQYIDNGRGDLRGLMASIDERVWLLENTPHDEYLRTGVASTRRSQPGHPDEHDITVLSSKDRETLRCISLQDWSRDRIVNGCWVSPLDVYQTNFPDLLARIKQGLQNGESARHPLDFHEDESKGRLFPREAQLHFRLPNGRLYSEIQSAFDTVLRLTLGPALQNCLNR